MGRNEARLIHSVGYGLKGMVWKGGNFDIGTREWARNGVLIIWAQGKESL